MQLTVRNVNDEFFWRQAPRRPVAAPEMNLNAYLLSPFPRQGTSGSGRIGSGFFCVCQQDSFYLLNRRILRFSGRCAAKRERNTVSLQARSDPRPEISKEGEKEILCQV